MTHGADAALSVCRIGDATQRGGNHVAMFERGRKIFALLRIVSQPVQEFGEPPFGRIHSAAPLHYFEILKMRRSSDLFGFALCTVVTPEVVLT